MITLQQANTILELARKLREADEEHHYQALHENSKAVQADCLFELLEYVSSLTIVEEGH